jgi:hypothetical protein
MRYSSHVSHDMEKEKQLSVSNLAGSVHTLRIYSSAASDESAVPQSPLHCQTLYQFIYRIH